MGLSNAFYNIQRHSSFAKDEEEIHWIDAFRAQFVSLVHEPEADTFKEDIWPLYVFRTIVIQIIMMTILIGVIVSNYDAVNEAGEAIQFD